MGEAARSKPATVPPMTRLLAHAKGTLNPPVHWRFPPLGLGGKNEPIKEENLVVPLQTHIEEKSWEG
jgi:hypothetical protein